MNIEKETNNHHSPIILAPAGNKASFLAALAAGADAVYCGLKDFSARMEAKNFSIEELSGLTQLAHDRGVKVYITLNSLIKPDDLSSAGKLLDQLNREVKPDALIIQDTSIIQLARQTGFSGELHLSTLANVSFTSALEMIDRTIPEVTRVVLPRELNIDEIKSAAKACPENLDLEVFIHGALCYGVSGRCYWSSFLGGKSGLRGRCVQPCRRMYSQKGPGKRYFSCQDLSLDVLVKVMLSIPKIGVWKIEGRKKSPHYVYYTVKAYKMMRDHGTDPQIKKDALSLLEQALGRTSTHYNFLPQRPQNPVNTDNQTGSGFLMGVIKGSNDKSYLVPRQELLPGDVLRIGYEDQKWHSIYRVTRFVPKKGRLFLKFNAPKSGIKNTPVFLTDRREKALQVMISEIEADLDKIKIP
ncbi:peptidase U32 family protein, partial [Desulfobacterales bacterium HSG17]|nr:peptidase U32 family protein [Desulfobacterales bacterium HSG17]